MIFNGEWIVPKYKITRTVVTYDDRPELYPGATAEEIILTAEQTARLEEIRYTPMPQSDAIAYVFDGIGAPPDNRTDIDKLIDLIPEPSAEVLEIVDQWEPDHKYLKGHYLKDNGKLYKVLQGHQSQSDWKPDKSPSLYAPLLTDPSGAVLPWVQPESTNPYMKGDRVLWTDGKTYESLIDNNVWSPKAYPQGWKEVV